MIDLQRMFVGETAETINDALEALATVEPASPTQTHKIAALRKALLEELRLTEGRLF